MIEHFRAESLQQARRPAARLAVVVVALLGIASLAITAWDSRPPTAEEIAAARGEVDRLLAEMGDLDARRQACEADRNAMAEDGQQGLRDCENLYVPKVEDYLREPVSYTSTAGETIGFAGAVLALVAFAVGAASMGAELSSGSMATLLVREPRRGRVLVAKTVAVGGLAAVSAIVVLAVFSAAMLGVSELSGAQNTVDRSVLLTITLSTLRSGALTAASAVLGLSMAGLTRHTAGALGGLGAMVLTSSYLSQSRPNLPPVVNVENTVLAWVRGGLPVPRPRCGPEGACVFDEVVLSQVQAGAALLLLVVVTGTLFAATFARRDLV